MHTDSNMLYANTPTMTANVLSPLPPPSMGIKTSSDDLSEIKEGIGIEVYTSDVIPNPPPPEVHKIIIPSSTILKETIDRFAQNVAQVY